VSTSRPLIAVVDDEESVRKALQRLLRSVGMDVKTFDSGTKFLVEFPPLKLDCLVLDLHMPCVTGFGVLATIGGRVPVVVITGQDSSENRGRAMDGGAVAYLRKPVTGVALIAAITAAIGDFRADAAMSGE
jgi:FixJ family two-component response regulator